MANAHQLVNLLTCKLVNSLTCKLERAKRWLRLMHAWLLVVLGFLGYLVILGLSSYSRISRVPSCSRVASYPRVSRLSSYPRLSSLAVFKPTNQAQARGLTLYNLLSFTPLIFYSSSAICLMKPLSFSFHCLNLVGPFSSSGSLLACFFSTLSSFFSLVSSFDL